MKLQARTFKELKYMLREMGLYDCKGLYSKVGVYHVFTIGEV